MSVRSFLLWDGFGPLSSHGGSDSNTIAILGIGFVIGLGLVYLGAKKWRIARLIKNTPVERARSAAVGRTELDGQSRDAGLTYEQPYSDGECVYRHWQVEEYRKDSDPDDNSKDWVVVDSGTDVAPFYVEDETGRVLVDTTEGPTFEISDGNTYSTTVGRGEEPPPEVQSFSGDEPSLSDTADMIGKVPGLGGVADAFGSGSMVEEIEESDDPEATSKRHQTEITEQYFDENVLNEDGTIRDDVSDEELQRAMDQEAMAGGPSGILDQMRGGGPDESGADSDGASGVSGEAAGNGGTADDGTPDVVEELGGTGTAGTLGTGNSLGEAIVQQGLYKASGGRLGSPSASSTFLGGSASRGSYNRRRYSHEVLPVDEGVHVFGEAEPRDGASGSNADRLKLGEESVTEQFIVTDLGEDGIVSGYTRRGPLYIGFGLLVSAGCLAGLLFSLGLA